MWKILILIFMLPIILCGNEIGLPDYIYFDKVIPQVENADYGIHLKLSCEKELKIGEERGASLLIESYSSLSKPIIYDFHIDIISSVNGFEISDPTFYNMESQSGNTYFSQMTDLSQTWVQIKNILKNVFIIAIKLISYKISIPIAVGELIFAGSDFLNTEDSDWHKLWDYELIKDTYIFKKPVNVSPWGNHQKYLYKFKLKRVSENASMDIFVDKIWYFLNDGSSNDGRHIDDLNYSIVSYGQNPPFTAKSINIDFFHDSSNNNPEEININATSKIYNNIPIIEIELTPIPGYNFEELSFSIETSKSTFLPGFPIIKNANEIDIDTYSMQELKAPSLGLKVFGAALAGFGAFPQSSNLFSNIFTIGTGAYNAIDEFDKYVNFTESVIYQWERQHNTDVFNFPPLKTKNNHEIKIILPYKAFDDEEIFLHVSGIVSPKAPTTPTITGSTVFDSHTFYNIFDLKENAQQSSNVSMDSNISLGFILDSSGSMKENDPNDIRKTALINIIKDRLTGSENLHIVDFDSGARLCNSNVSGWSKRDIIDAVKKIDSSGGTNVEVGLDAMSSSLNQNGFSNNTGVMLLTDGKGEYTDAAQWYMNNGIKVYTVSFVGDADEVLLRNIAQQTGGIYMRANTAEQICNLFNLFYDLLTGSSMFVYHQDQIHQGDVLDYYFPIDNVEGNLYFATNWAGSSVDMKIISPSGKVFTENDGNGKWNVGDTYITASIPSIEVGDWEVQLIGSQIPAQGEQVNLEVHGKSDLFFDIGMSAQGGMVDFQINSNMKHLINNYYATVTVETPNGNEINISDKLQNNALHFFPTSGKGSYRFTFLINGNRNDGSKFQRQLTRYYFAGEHAIPYISPITDIIGNCVYANIGEVVGNAPGIKCYIYRGDINNYKNCIAEGYIIHCKDMECTAEIDYYLQNTKAQIGDILKLDEDDWRAD